MLKLARRSLILILLLVPSAHFAWQDRAMPDFGYLHDDGIFFVTAKSVASGHYRIESLPELPSQTKFPPLYPLYLSLIWKLNPNFPANLAVATGLSWLVLATSIVLALALYYREGFLEWRIWVFTGLVALNPYMILFGTRMFSEVFFICWVLAAFLVLSRDGIQAAAIAGIFAGCAYLSRTAGLVLLISVPAVLIWKREFRRAGAFALGMLPAVIGWSLWTRAHLPASSDPTLLYYADYMRYQSLNIGFDNLAVLLWKNIDQILYGMGSLALPKVADSLLVKILTQVIAFAMIAGVVRLVRRGAFTQYAAFGVVSLAVLLVWHFPPNERFVLPLFPLLAAGLVTELQHLGKMLRSAFSHRDASQRAMAAIFAAIALIVFGSAAALQGYVTWVFLHESAQSKVPKLNDERAAYSWISANLPRDAAILSYDDPLLYLSTGHRGNYLPLLSRWWYAEDHASIIGAYRNVAEYCRSRGLSYMLFTTEDLSRETGEEDRQAVEKSIRANPRLKEVFRSGMATVYKVE